jgi:hypothetical protein
MHVYHHLLFRMQHGWKVGLGFIIRARRARLIARERSEPRFYDTTYPSCIWMHLSYLHIAQKI